MKHFEWKVMGEEQYDSTPQTWTPRETISRGRVACGVDCEGRFRFAQIAGQAPRPGVLYSILESPDFGFVQEQAEILDRSARVHRAGVEVRRGMSGCIDLLLREERDVVLCDYPIVARIHISMFGKINEPLKFWLGDLPRLLRRMRLEFQEDLYAVSVEEVPVFANTGIFDTDTEEAYKVADVPYAEYAEEDPDPSWEMTGGQR